MHVYVSVISDMYGSKQGRLDAVPMNDIGPGYAPIDEQRNQRNKPPAGAVPLFPNMSPVCTFDLKVSSDLMLIENNNNLI